MRQKFSVSKRCSQGPRRLSTYIIITKAQTTARLSLHSRAHTQKKARERLFFAAAATSSYNIKRAARNITMELGSDKTFSLSVAMNMQPAFQDARLSFIKAPLPFANTALEQNIGRLTKHAAPRCVHRDDDNRRLEPAK